MDTGYQMRNFSVKSQEKRKVRIHARCINPCYIFVINGTHCSSPVCGRSVWVRNTRQPFLAHPIFWPKRQKSLLCKCFVRRATGRNSCIALISKQTATASEWELERESLRTVSPRITPPVNPAVVFRWALLYTIHSRKPPMSLPTIYVPSSISIS